MRKTVSDEDVEDVVKTLGGAVVFVAWFAVHLAALVGIGIVINAVTALF
jgi:hypothetical protein